MSGLTDLIGGKEEAKESCCGGSEKTEGGPTDGELRSKVRAALEDIRPGLQADGGDVELVNVTDEGIVQVKLTGACAGCPMSQMTLQLGIERHLMAEVPGVAAVEAV